MFFDGKGNICLLLVTLDRKRDYLSSWNDLRLGRNYCYLFAAIAERLLAAHLYSKNMKYHTYHNSMKNHSFWC